ncbi:hypothetical protein [Micromonospora sp. DT62]|uniref:hypothetical protein n=1 Tax=Micromonospora sp. DT62 TaxID=3416521 RepID=UPI003CF19290
MRIVGWTAGAICSLGLVGLGVVFVQIGVTAADKWASALGIFVSVLGLALSVHTAASTRRSMSQAGAGPGDRVDNTIQGGEFAQSVVQARDLTIGGPSSPSATTAPALTSPAAVAGAGRVTNTIRTGTFHGPVTQARDVGRQPLDPPVRNDEAGPSRGGVA